MTDLNFAFTYSANLCYFERTGTGEATSKCYKCYSAALIKPHVGGGEADYDIFSFSLWFVPSNTSNTSHRDAQGLV